VTVRPSTSSPRNRAQRRAPKVQSRRHVWRLDDEQLGVEPQVGNVGHVAFEHPAIPGQSHGVTVVDHPVVDVPPQVTPATVVEAGEVGPIALGEVHPPQATESDSSARRLGFP
jgi:hypothetical protein